MWRGLGPVQRRVLEVLPTLGGSTFALELTMEVFGTEDPSDSQLVSLRRAANALAARGLVRTGYDPAGSLFGSTLCLAVWLPDRPTPIGPVRRPRWGPAEMDDAVLAAVRSISQTDADEWRSARRRPRAADAAEAPPRLVARGVPWVPYRMAAARAADAVGARDARGRLLPAGSRAIRRSLARLARRKLITLLPAATGRRPRYRAVLCAGEAEFDLRQRPRRSLSEAPTFELVRRSQTRTR